jgi:hypothetical protein
MGQLSRDEQLASAVRHHTRRTREVNPQLVSSATLNSLILSVTVFLTIISAMFLGIYSGYLAVSGILRAMSRRPAKATAPVLQFPANVTR